MVFGSSCTNIWSMKKLWALSESEAMTRMPAIQTPETQLKNRVFWSILPSSPQKHPQIALIFNIHPERKLSVLAIFA